MSSNSTNKLPTKNWACAVSEILRNNTCRSGNWKDYRRHCLHNSLQETEWNISLLCRFSLPSNSLCKLVRFGWRHSARHVFAADLASNSALSFYEHGWRYFRRFVFCRIYRKPLTRGTSTDALLSIFRMVYSVQPLKISYSTQICNKVFHRKRSPERCSLLWNLPRKWK